MGLMVLRGYCYINLKVHDDAERIFSTVASIGGGKKISIRQHSWTCHDVGIWQPYYNDSLVR
jgi:hypothetical protein